jgi:hypothetical protein
MSVAVAIPPLLKRKTEGNRRKSAAEETLNAEDQAKGDGAVYRLPGKTSHPGGHDAPNANVSSRERMAHQSVSCPSVRAASWSDKTILASIRYSSFIHPGLTNYKLRPASSPMARSPKFPLPHLPSTPPKASLRPVAAARQIQLAGFVCKLAPAWIGASSDAVSRRKRRMALASFETYRFGVLTFDYIRDNEL